MEFGQDWFVRESDKVLINKLLLEKIPLAGICRACNIGQTWLLKYIKQVYACSPDYLNADLNLPDIESHCADNFDKDITRLMAVKKLYSIRYLPVCGL